MLQLAQLLAHGLVTPKQLAGITAALAGQAGSAPSAPLITVQRADQIIVLHKGKVRETGSHQELLAQRGIYYKLYQLQYTDQEVNVTRAPTPV